jgi:hypothetical protein
MKGIYFILIFTKTTIKKNKKKIKNKIKKIKKKIK